MWNRNAVTTDIDLKTRSSQLRWILFHSHTVCEVKKTKLPHVSCDPLVYEFKHPFYKLAKGGKSVGCERRKVCVCAQDLKSCSTSAHIFLQYYGWKSAPVSHFELWEATVIIHDCARDHVSVAPHEDRCVHEKFCSISWLSRDWRHWLACNAPATRSHPKVGGKRAWSIFMSDSTPQRPLHNLIRKLFPPLGKTDTP